MIVCRKCVLPKTYRNISFDSQGVCNYCRVYEENKDKLTDWNYLDRLKSERLQRAKDTGNSEYDVILGLSGGKDSSWLALELTRKKLKVLSFTFDNGFLTDYARNNIKKVVENLKIDHFYQTVDPKLQKEFYACALRQFGTPCFGCSYSSYAFSYKIALEKDIPIVIHGRSRSQMFRELLARSLDPFLPMIKINVNPYDNRTNLQALLKAKQRMAKFLSIAIPDQKILDVFYKTFFPDENLLYSKNNIPEFVGYFLYQPYDERIMMNQLEEELDWKKPSSNDLLSHSDCSIHDAVGYIHKKVNRYPLLSFELSVMIRECQMTRKEAMARLTKEPGESWVPEKSLRELCYNFDINYKDLPKIWAKIRLKNRLRNLYLKVQNFFDDKKLDL